MRRSSRTLFVALVWWLALPVVVRAGGPIGPNGAPIQTSSYAVDLYQGPVFAGSRVTGLGGAYVAISEDIDGDLQNPATPALRPFYSFSHFDYWLGFGLTFPATLSGVDFFNTGSKTSVQNAPSSFVFFTPAVNLQWGEFGIGATLEMQHYALSAATPDSPSVNATIPTTHLQIAHGFDHNQWVFGVGARFASLSVGATRGEEVFESTGTGIELGMVWKPEWKPFRVGAAFRSEIRTEAHYQDGLLPNSQGDLILSDDSGSMVFLPRSVALPWDLNVGIAIQFGGRPLNPPWRPIHELVERDSLNYRLRQLQREDARARALERAKTTEERAAIEEGFQREQDADDRELARVEQAAYDRISVALQGMNRHYLTISTSLLISGTVEDGVGVESMVTQVVNRSGQHVVFSPRVGIEAAVIPTWLKIRAGGYLEPTRVETSTPRMHGTLGLDLRLFVWNVFGLWPDDYMWRLGLGADAARDYVTWGITIGGWYPRRTGPPQGS